MRPVKILVATPLPHGARLPAAMRLLPVQLQPIGPMEFRDVAGYQVDQNRERLAQRAVDGGFSHLFFLDADVWPPAQVLPLLDRWRHPVTSGCYWSRNGWLAAGMFDPGKAPQWSPVRWPLPQPKALVDVVGLGCCLIQVDVLRRMSRPWFRYVEGPDGMSEDTWFALKLRDELGLNVMLDGEVQCAHQLDAWVLPGGMVDLQQPGAAA